MLNPDRNPTGKGSTRERQVPDSKFASFVYSSELKDSWIDFVRRPGVSVFIERDVDNRRVVPKNFRNPISLIS